MIQVARSRGNVIAVEDFSDNLMRVESGPWPPAAIVQKLCASSRHAGAFDGEARQLLTRKLGFYSDLQSLHSEDAITWSYFGILSAVNTTVRISFLNWLLHHIGLPAAEKACSMDLWRRIPHPDTQGMGGPEIDFLLQGDRTVILGEAKWRSGEGSGQGVTGMKSQLQLRREFCDGMARAILGPLRFVVLGVVRDCPLAADTAAEAVTAVRSITWTSLATWSEHPRAAEFSRYHEWKTHWSKR